MNAIAASSSLQTDVNMKLFQIAKNTASSQMANMLQGFANAQPAPHPFLGRNLDIRV